MVVIPVRTRIFRENEDVADFVMRHVRRLPEGAILAVSSKMVALSEGRTAPANQKNALIKRESKWAIRTPRTWLTLKDGMLMASAGIDESNADGKLVLLPKDSFKSAQKLRAQLKKVYKLKRLGVVITDSRIFPLRAGTTAAALGYAGFKGLRDYRGKKDLFGRKLAMTQTNIADSLATAAVLLMGEGNERQPLAVIEDAPVTFTERISRRELVMNGKDDMYAPLLRPLFRK